MLIEPSSQNFKKKKEQPEIEFEENQSLKGQQIQQTSTHIIKISNCEQT